MAPHEGYHYVEFPKCLYQAGGATLVVDNAEEEENAAALGWLTAEKFHAPAGKKDEDTAEGDPLHEEGSDK